MITIIVPFYRNEAMLIEQLAQWALLPEEFNFVVVDDGSPEPAREIVLTECPGSNLLQRIAVYRIKKDIPWNRGGARNLGTHVAKTDWILHMDIDHVLPWASAEELLLCPLSRGRWYRFPRWRVGKADDTRKKDKIDPNCEFGQIHPHVDSYICTKTLYWRAGGYDEDYSGCLGGGTPFLQALENIVPPLLLPDAIPLHVYTRSVIKDASDWALSRDTAEFSARKAKKRISNNLKPKNPLRFEWERLL